MVKKNKISGWHKAIPNTFYCLFDYLAVLSET